jgi:hypothetical protein
MKKRLPLTVAMLDHAFNYPPAAIAGRLDALVHSDFASSWLFGDEVSPGQSNRLEKMHSRFYSPKNKGKRRRPPDRYPTNDSTVRYRVLDLYIWLLETGKELLADVKVKIQEKVIAREAEPRIDIRAVVYPTSAKRRDQDAGSADRL